MALRPPVLDDKAYAQLRDEMVRRIPVYSPEWTNHSSSDPGITLISLFAFLGDSVMRGGLVVTDFVRDALRPLLGSVSEESCEGNCDEERNNKA